MKIYKRHRFPPDIISYAVWLYYRFSLSHRDIEDLLAERGVTVSHESIRLWCNKFGPKYARRLKRKHQGYGDTFYIDEVFVKIKGELHYLWRAVDQDGDVVDVLLQSRRDGNAAKRFFQRLIRSHGKEPRKIVTTNSAVTEWPTGSSYQRSFTTMPNMPTTGPNYHINPLECGRGKCVDSNLPGRRNVS